MNPYNRTSPYFDVRLPYFRRLFCRTVSLIFLVVFSGPVHATAEPRFALWVEVEGTNRPFDDAKGFETFKNFTADKGFTDLYCQIYRGGRSWFPSSYADDGPYQASLAKGVDPLKDTLALGKARGQKVHAWVNVLRIAHNAKAPIVKELGENAVLTDSHGQSLLSYSLDGKAPGPAGHYFQLDTPAYWLDPSQPAVRKYVVDTLRELAKNYPELAGIHMDMVRFPFSMRIKRSSNYQAGMWYGYSEEALGRFYEDHLKTSDGTAEPKLPTFKEWQRWRGEQITEFVKEVRAAIKAENPKLEFSAAVLGWPDRSEQHSLQFWKEWISAGLVDVITPMSYTRDNDAVRAHTKFAVQHGKASKTGVIMGLGAWLLLSRPERAAEQTAISLQNGALGVNLFSYSNLLSSRGERLVQLVRQEIDRQR